ncbi:MAG TPA: bifunctional serine/threonine-protein kinase/formylglycine-generating enzyme family protein [Candidatus Hydrogenedentes bacterium]|nr:bifunctional serine/threonine-protein kinase/formylglycine-generating enzyme family protein [Candidatus Hydrogenedentota bacterium]
MIEVVCSQCGLRILAPPTVQGKEGVCFNCRAPLRVPSAALRETHLNLAFERGDRVSDRYIIEERIGKGGMGVVYRALDALVKEPVALKFMHPEMLRTEKGRQMFIQEAQIARRLRHENIVAVHDVAWTSEGILYLSMEFLSGQSLRAFLRKKRTDRRLVEVRLGVTLLKQVLAALEYAHRTVIHRDIKPENVFLLAGERIKVLDFGLAKVVHEELLTATADAAASGHPVGTLGYSAPEQRLRRAVDLRADLYSVGLLFYELLTLRTPLDDYVPTPQVREDVSPGLLAVLDRAVAEEKERRWQSATEFRVALEEAFETAYGVTTVQVLTPNGDKQPSTDGMVYIEGGNFLMGNNEVRDEAPEEEVYVAPFWMDVHPVTVAEFARFLEATGRPEPKYWRDPQYNGPDQPVVGVTWAEAFAYAQWLGKDLPTEAQWEFAARGKENRRYPWGSLPPDPTRCNFGENLGMPSIIAMHESGATPEGIQDMAGNVMEWTKDPFVPYPVARRPGGNGPPNAPRRAVRGGCWSSKPEELACTARKGLFPESRLATVGFRGVIPLRRGK